MAPIERFNGYIAGIGSTSGTRLVVGHWLHSPFGAFTDVMIQGADGERVLLAPTEALADYVGATYHFDRILVTELAVRRTESALCVEADCLSLSVAIGGSTALGCALSLVPRAVAVHPRWLTLVNPLASLLVPGARTAGSAGNGRREYYGVTNLRAITAVCGYWNRAPLGPLQPVTPPVTFGFSSTPAQPLMATVSTSIVSAG